MLLSFRSAEQVTLVYKMKLCEEVKTMYLYSFNGVNFDPVSTSERSEANTFEFAIDKSEPRFYYVGTAMNNVKPVILGAEPKVVLEGDCHNVRNADILESVSNANYNELTEDMRQKQIEMSQIIAAFRASQNDSAKLAGVIQQFAELDKGRLYLIEQWKKKDPFMAKILLLNTYLSYHNNGSNYPGEAEYFASEYFQLVDWSAKEYHYTPWVYEATKNYTETLSMLGFPDAVHKAYLDKMLQAIPADSRTYQLALGGVIAALKAKTHANYLPFAQQFIQKYKTTAPQATAALEQEIKQASTFLTGVEAPDFTQPTPDGENLSLSDFRGKVLLVDFWASWCGPCRRENPNVVRMYKKYKDKGFEILGVSLDDKKDRWLGAIEQDGLEWPHVSDLKGWQNAAAQAYGIRSIPHTLLLDEKGRIIARNLRGPALESKLDEIFKTAN